MTINPILLYAEIALSLIIVQNPVINRDSFNKKQHSLFISVKKKVKRNVNKYWLYAFSSIWEIKEVVASNSWSLQLPPSVPGRLEINPKNKIKRVWHSATIDESTNKGRQCSSTPIIITRGYWLLLVPL